MWFVGHIIKVYRLAWILVDLDVDIMLVQIIDNDRMRKAVVSDTFDGCFIDVQLAVCQSFIYFRSSRLDPVCVHATAL